MTADEARISVTTVSPSKLHQEAQGLMEFFFDYRAIHDKLT